MFCTFLLSVSQSHSHESSDYRVKVKAACGKRGSYFFYLEQQLTSSCHQLIVIHEWGRKKEEETRRASTRLKKYGGVTNSRKKTPNKIMGL